MSQSTITMNANQSGNAFTSDISNALAAVDTCHSGTGAPTLNVAAGKLWLDTSLTSPILKIYNSGWKNLFTVGSSNIQLNVNSATFSDLTSTTSALGTMTGASLDLSGAITAGSLDLGAGSLTAGATSLAATGVTTLSASAGIDITGDELRVDQIDNYSGTNITVQAGFDMGNNTINCGTIISTGDLTVSGSATVNGNIHTVSDRRLKSNINNIKDAMSKVAAINGVTYVMNGVEQAGVIAQEVEAVLPEVVQTDLETGQKSVAYGNMAGLLIEALKEQQRTIRALEYRITKLEE
jgi:hypothetical protein